MSHLDHMKCEQCETARADGFAAGEEKAWLDAARLVCSCESKEHGGAHISSCMTQAFRRRAAAIRALPAPGEETR